MPRYVTTVKIVYVTDGVTVKVSLLCLAIRMCQILINSYMINHCLFVLKLFSPNVFCWNQNYSCLPPFWTRSTPDSLSANTWEWDVLLIRLSLPGSHSNAHLQKHTDTHEAPLDDRKTPAPLQDTASTSWLRCWLILINWYTDRSSLEPLPARQKLRVAFCAVIEPANDDISAWKSRSTALQLINNISG